MFGKQQDDLDDFKKRRDAETEKLRKGNREEIFSKRRNILTQESNTSNIDLEQQRKERLLVVDDRYRH